MSPQDRKVAQYHQQWERQNNTSLWFAFAIVSIAVIGIGVFLMVASGSGGRSSGVAQALHFGKTSAPIPTGDR
jgi:hypothetical protein